MITEVIKKLKEQYPEHFETREGFCFKNGNANLYSRHDTMLTLEFGLSEIDAVGTKDCKELLIFFENPFHLIERLTNRKLDLNSYVYRRLNELKEKGYVLLDSGELSMTFKNDEGKLIYTINFFTGEIKEFKH